MATGFMTTSGDRIVEELQRGHRDPISDAGMFASVLHELDENQVMSIVYGVLQWLTEDYAIGHNRFPSPNVRSMITRAKLTQVAIELMYPERGREDDAG